MAGTTTARFPARRLVAPLLVGGASFAIAAAPAISRPIQKPRTLRNVLVTEYFPVPETWFVGKKVSAPGLRGKHRVDWLYSARGVSMEGDGIGLDGRRYHISGLGDQGWVTEAGKRTHPGRSGWSAGPPFWRDVGWRDRRGRVTFPLAAGGWYAGRPHHSRSTGGISFAGGPSRPLRFYRSVAVDPDLIPMGSRIYIPAFRHTSGGGWFRAEDVGGAIQGRHLDVYRPPPTRPGGGEALYGQTVRVIPP